MIFKARPGTILTSVGNQIFLVSVNKRLRLNDTALFCWERLSSSKGIEDLIQAFMDEYEIMDAEELDKQVRELLEELQRGHWIEVITE